VHAYCRMVQCCARCSSRCIPYCNERSPKAHQSWEAITPINHPHELQNRACSDANSFGINVQLPHCVASSLRMSGPASAWRFVQHGNIDPGAACKCDACALQHARRYRHRCTAAVIFCSRPTRCCARQAGSLHCRTDIILKRVRERHRQQRAVHTLIWECVLKRLQR